MADVVRDGAVVSLEYELKLANGEVVDYSETDEPLEYLHGAENIIPGLEKELAGLQVGDEKDVEVPPADGYGEYDPEDVEVVERGALPKNIPLQLGMVLAVSDENGDFSEAFVREISPNSVTLDFNHPLAGQRLFFKVKVLGIREATEEELAHGHPHGAHGHDEDDEFDFEDDEDFEDFLDEDEDDEDFEDFEDDEPEPPARKR
ncbi:MAG: peptidylprolyl isomerase [Anaerolineae bacterium]|nr:peptidylprolyl isomerase [Anaerolineae bacterium]